MRTRGFQVSECLQKHVDALVAFNLAQKQKHDRVIRNPQFSPDVCISGGGIAPDVIPVREKPDAGMAMFRQARQTLMAMNDDRVAVPLQKIDEFLSLPSQRPVMGSFVVVRPCQTDAQQTEQTQNPDVPNFRVVFDPIQIHPPKTCPYPMGMFPDVRQ